MFIRSTERALSHPSQHRVYSTVMFFLFAFRFLITGAVFPADNGLLYPCLWNKLLPVFQKSSRLLKREIENANGDFEGRSLKESSATNKIAVS